MTDHQMFVLVGEAMNYSDRDAFVSDAALSSAWPEDQDIEKASAFCGQIWDAINLPISEIRKRMGLTQVQMAERLCVPRRTLENWEYRGTCPIYIKLLIYRVWFGLKPN